MNTSVIHKQIDSLPCHWPEMKIVASNYTQFLRTKDEAGQAGGRKPAQNVRDKYRVKDAPFPKTWVNVERQEGAPPGT